MNHQSKPYSDWDRADIATLLETASSGEHLAALRDLAGSVEHVRAVPGIVIAGGAAGPRARIAGTGLDVFELIEDYLDLDRDACALTDVYDWLTTAQIQSALAYFEAFPDEIRERIALEEAFVRALDSTHR